MTPMSPVLRKWTLTAHIISSVGWLGAVAVFLVFSLIALLNRDAGLVRAADLAMGLTAWMVIVPLAFASLLTGIVQSLGTTWGLIRHWWTVAKLSLTLLATIVLLFKMELISRVAAAALAGSDLHQARMQLLVHASGGLLVLVVTTALSVFKPWGQTRLARPNKDQTSDATSANRPMPLKIAAIVVGLIVAGLVVFHLFRGGLAHLHSH